MQGFYFDEVCDIMRNMNVQLSPQLNREIASVKEYGYRNTVEFIEDAVRHRIFELKSGIKLNLSQKKDLKQAREEIRKGEYSTLEEFNERHGYQPTPRHNRQNPQKPKRKR